MRRYEAHVLGAVVMAVSAISMVPASMLDAQEEASESGAGPREEDPRSVRRLGDVVGAGQTDFMMDIPVMDAPPTGERPDVSVPDPDRNARLQALLDRRASAGEVPEVVEALEALIVEIRDAGLRALAAGDLEDARARQSALAVLAPEAGIATRIAAEVAARNRIERQNRELARAIDENRLLAPPEGSAAWHLRRLSELAPDAAITAAASEQLAEALRARFDKLLSEKLLTEAAAWIDAVEDAPAVGLDMPAWREALRVATRERIGTLEQTARRAIRSGESGAARAALGELNALGAEDALLVPLQSELDRLQRYGDFAPGQRFSDALSQSVPQSVSGPEMVVVPTGSVRLGSPPDERGRFSDEGPSFTVEIKRGFALSETEITVSQFGQFARATGYRTDAERAGSSNTFDERTSEITGQRFVDWQQNYLGNRAADDLPVVHVSFNDARAYAEWLARETGKPYRLPSEAEFEYALRAGNATRFWWGDGSPENETENIAGDSDRLGRGQRWSDAFDDYRDGFWGPAPVGTFRANPFGLYDMGGNVLEWTADCWFDGYDDPPVDGSARIRNDCARRVLRGGAWSNGPASCRSAYRLSGRADFSDARVGFRVARDLVETGILGPASAL